MSDLRDNVVLITGGGSGLGLALIERFIDEGAKVATLELSGAKVASLRQRFGDRVLAVEGSVTRYGDYQRAVDQILTTYGRLDCFIGNAGIWDHNASLMDTPAEALENSFHELFNVNVLGYLLGAKACAPALIASEGSIILTLSNAARYPGGGGRSTPPANMRRPANSPAGLRAGAEGAGQRRWSLRNGDRSARPAGAGAKRHHDNALPDGGEDRRHPATAVFPEPVDFTGPYVMLASRRNNRTLSGVMINADGGLGIRGIRHVAAGLNL